MNDLKSLIEKLQYKGWSWGLILWQLEIWGIYIKICVTESEWRIYQNYLKSKLEQAHIEVDFLVHK